MKDYYEANKATEIARHAKWAAENKEHLAKYRRVFRRTTDKDQLAWKRRQKEQAEKLRASQRKCYSDVDGYTRYHLKNKFGLTVERYKQMLEEQNNCCAICGDRFTGRRPHVDHCHKTNEVRALLCGNCNIGIGNFKDSPHRLFLAIQYLHKFQVHAAILDAS